MAQQPKTVRLNVGSGDTLLPGYIPIDRKLGREAYPLDVPDNSVDEIRASHVLEHFSHREMYYVLAHWVQKLKVGGVLKIAVPDFRKIAEQYMAGESNMACQYVMGGQIDDDDQHRCIFDESSLRMAMERAGLEDIQHWESEVKDTASLPISLNLMGRKSERARRELKAVAVMSMPRLCFTDNVFTAIGVLRPLGISFEWGTGVFWGQVLTRLMTQHLHDGTEVIITMDYDTWFHRNHVIRLFQLLAAHPEADAIIPMQVQRERDLVMAGRSDDIGHVKTGYTDEDLSSELIPTGTGHFGLTVFRVSSLRDLPHPWFVGKPNAQGKWEYGRMDDDIWFWHNFAENGRKAFVAPDVRIGHMQLMCTFPAFRDGGCVPAHVHMSDVTAGKVPPGCIPDVEMESHD